MSNSDILSKADKALRPVLKGLGRFSWVRIEGCDTCRRYLKVIDLTRDPEADPLADELATAPLDVHATEAGYQKLLRNLIGL